MSNPSDWMQMNFIDVSQTEISPTTTPTTTTTAAAAAAATCSRNNNLSLDEGRISKPIRRRSRASRRTPTTLLNTDTTNFRAMVQQLTGSPTTTYAARSQLSTATGMLGFTQHIGSATASVSPASGFRVQYPNQMQQHQMFMVNNMHGGGGGGGVSSHAPPESSSTNENRNYDNYML